MVIAINNLVRKARAEVDLHIVNMIYDGIYDAMMTHCGFKSSFLTNDSVVPANPGDYKRENTAITPVRTLLNTRRSFDSVVCHDRDEQRKLIDSLSSLIHLPIVQVDHLALDESVDVFEHQEQLEKQKSAISVATNPKAFDDWKSDFYVPCGTNIFEDEKKPLDVLVVGRFLKDEYFIVSEMLKDIDNCKIVGDNPGLSVPIHDYKQFEQMFRIAKVYVNLSTRQDIPSNLVMALGAGCAVISNETNVTKDILADSSVTCNNISDLNKAIKELLANETKLRALSSKAIALAKEEFPMDRFVDKWNEIIKQSKTELFLHG